MRKFRSKFSLILLVAMFGLPTYGAETMTLTSAGNNGTLAGIYIGPYTALINNVPTLVICDDFSSETNVNQTWTATEFSMLQLQDNAILQQTRWGREGFGLADYTRAAWLSMQLMDPTRPGCTSDQCAGDIQFAIWSLFDPNATAHLTSQAPSHLDDVDLWLQRSVAGSQGLDISNVFLYTPTASLNAPQEFIVIKTPEPGELLLLMTELSGVLALAWFVRRRATARS